MTNNIVWIREAPLREIKQRVHPRTSVFYQSTVEMKNGTAKGIVRNISAGGACLSISDVESDAGDAIALTLRHIGHISGMVSWVRAGRMGITFDRPIDPAQVLCHA